MTEGQRTADASDERLFDEWLGGGERAGRDLIRRYYRRIMLFFYDKVGPEVGKDLTQSTFETLCAKRRDFRGDSSVRTYLFGIARWKLVDHFRALQRKGRQFQPLEHSVELPGVERSITSLFMERQRESLVVRALRSLPLDDQIVLGLKEYESMSARQIAAVYGVGRDTMSSRITRARARLTRAVEDLADSAQMVETTLVGLDAYLRDIRERIGSSMDAQTNARS